jgi:hypothetical protein
MSESRVERLFDFYSKNLNAVKRHPRVHVELEGDGIDENDMFICPLCFKAFPREAVRSKDITLEHIPPDSLGGKARTLTCRACNNWAGHELDSQLVKEQNIRDFFSDVPGSSMEAKLQLEELSDEISLPVTVNVDGEERPGYDIIGQPERTNPKHIEKVVQSFESGVSGIKLSFYLYRRNRPEVARLRIAYLWAFSVFGYGYVLLNPHLGFVRFQIQNPKDKKLGTWELPGVDIPDLALGINVVTEPKELASFLVVFDLSSPLGTTTRHAVMLPGFGEPGTDIYNQIGQRRGKGEVSFAPLPEKDIRSNIHKFPFIPWSIWRTRTDIARAS